MIFTLIAWIYISIICHTWGELTFGLIKKIAGDKSNIPLHISIICLLGLAHITVLLSFFSLFVPLGGWMLHLLLLIPCLFFLITYKKNSYFNTITGCFSELTKQAVLLLALCLLLLLIMSSSEIGNQDTLGYHAQNIQWIEKYKAIPGIANLHLRYGFQSNWFISCAAFSFRFINTNALTFINSTILIWYIFFVVCQINKGYSDKSKTTRSLFWLLLLAINFWSYTQVRLAATSGSPDFIVTIFIWLLFYFLFSENSDTHLSVTGISLTILLSFFALTLKLSAIPVIITALYGFYRLFVLKKIKTILLLCLIILGITIPYVTRNIISSGYPFYPVETPDIAGVDWKIEKARTILLKDYTTAYAKNHSEATAEGVKAAMALKPGEWLPGWWNMQSLADKLILAIAGLSLLIIAARITYFVKANEKTKIGLTTAFAGILLWFIKAPDPRFGFGFLIALPAILIIQFDGNILNKTGISQNSLLRISSVIIKLFLILYLGYRCIYFFSPSQVILTSEIKKIKYNTIKCDNVILNIPVTNNNCGTINIPCTYDSCQTFTPRGNEITDGFRPK